jgi:hypothetical protein
VAFDELSERRAVPPSRRPKQFLIRRGQNHTPRRHP